VPALKGKLDDPNFLAITYKLHEGRQLTPVLCGKGVRVQTIVIAHQQWGETIAEISRQYELCPSAQLKRP
jgi:uncharacterized protein (DUF433 family)